MTRFAAIALLVISAVLAPFWLTSLVAVIFMFAFNMFYEAVAVIFFLEAAAASSFPFTIAAFLAVLAAEFLKTRIRWYETKNRI